MSILDSRDEVAAAESKLATVTDEQLRIDLAYWTVAACDASAEYTVLHNRVAAVRTEHAEAESWASLIGAELRRRRDARRAGGPG
jgi:hypothetical protein